MLTVLARLLCMRSVIEERKQKKLQAAKHAMTTPTNHGCYDQCLVQADDKQADVDARAYNAQPMASNNDLSIGYLTREVAATKAAILRLERSVQPKEEKMTGSPLGDATWEWRCVGNVIDRLFFWIYLGLIVLSLVLFFPRPEGY